MTDDDDGFIDLLPTKLAAREKNACVFGAFTMGKNNLQKASVAFDPDHIDDETLAILQSARFSVAFSPKLMCVRIRADTMGKYERWQPPRSRVQVIRFPFPAGLFFSKQREPATFDPNPEQKSILVDVPRAFHVRPAPAARVIIPTAPTNVTAGLMGDPPKGRSAADRTEHLDLAASKPCSIPKVIKGVSLTPSERQILELLLKRDQASREQVLIATCPAGYEDKDDRDENIASVFVSKLRPKLAQLGIEISTGFKSWSLEPAAKATLRSLIGGA